MKRFGNFCTWSGLLSSSQSRSSAEISKDFTDAEASERFDEAARGCSFVHQFFGSMEGRQVGAFDGTGAGCAAGLAESVPGFLEAEADRGGVLGGVGVFPRPLVGA